MRFARVNDFQDWLAAKGLPHPTAYYYSHMARRAIEAMAEPLEASTVQAHYDGLPRAARSIFPTIWRRLVQFGGQEMGRQIPNPFGPGRGPI